MWLLLTLALNNCDFVANIFLFLIINSLVGKLFPIKRHFFFVISFKSQIFHIYCIWLGQCLKSDISNDDATLDQNHDFNYVSPKQENCSKWQFIVALSLDLIFAFLLQFYVWDCSTPDGSTWNTITSIFRHDRRALFLQSKSFHSSAEFTFESNKLRMVWAFFCFQFNQHSALWPFFF